MPVTSAVWLRVLLIQGGIGLSWLFGDPTRTASKSYAPAIHLGEFLGLGWYPVRGYGLLLCVITAGLVWSMVRGSTAVLAWSLGLAAFWAFWAFLFLVAIFTANGGIASMFFAAGFSWYALDRAIPPGLAALVRAWLRTRRR